MLKYWATAFYKNVYKISIASFIAPIIRQGEFVENKIVLIHNKSFLCLCTIFLKNMNDYIKVNEVYSTYFISKPPAREAVQVSVLPKNVNIEISAIACF